MSNQDKFTSLEIEGIQAFIAAHPLSYDHFKNTLSDDANMVLVARFMVAMLRHNDELASKATTQGMVDTHVCDDICHGRKFYLYMFFKIYPLIQKLIEDGVYDLKEGLEPFLDEHRLNEIA